MDLDEALTGLTAENVETRRTAARSLWLAAQSTPERLDEMAAALDDALTDEDSLVRGHAVATLGDVLFATKGYDEPMPELDGVLARLTDEDEAVRQTVTGVLWNREWWYDLDADWHPITDDQLELAAVGLVDCLDDPLALTRKRASNELGASLVDAHPNPDEAVSAMVSTLAEAREDVRSNVAELLADLVNRRPALLDPHVDDLQAAMADADSVDPDLANGLANLVERHPELASPVVSTLLDADVDAAWMKKKHVATLGDVLAVHPDGVERADDAVAELESALTVTGTRVAAAKALRRVAATAPERVEPVAPALRERLGDASEDVRKHAACALAAVLDDDRDPALVALVDVYDSADPKASVPDPLVELAPDHPAFVRERLERMREETPNPGHETRLTVAAILGNAPDAAHPFLDGCAADLGADEEAVRNGAAWILGQTVIEQPDEGKQYRPALESALDTPEAFEEYAHRKLVTALEALDERDDETASDA